MKKLLPSIILLLVNTLLYAQQTVTTSPPLSPNNGQSGISFEVESNLPVNILEIWNIFSSATSANVWVRQGGVQHNAGSPPVISVANGWTQEITNAPITGANSTSKVQIPFGGNTIFLQPNTPYGIFIEGDTRYQTHTTSSQSTFTDGTLTIRTGPNYGYGGAFPSPTFHPRQFVGDVVYGIGGGCPVPTNVQTQSVNCDQITVEWNSPSGSSVLVHGPQGFNLPNGTMTGVISSPYTITGLQSGTDYDVYVADTCGSDTSIYMGPYTFTTSGNVFQVSFDHTVGVLAFDRRIVYFDASPSLGASNFEWDFGDGNTESGMFTSHIYKSNGIYYVKLMAGSNCKADTVGDTVVVEGIGLGETPLIQSFNIFPNPAGEWVNIEFNSDGNSAIIRLLDLSGKTLVTRRSEGLRGTYSEQLDLANFSRGMYLVEIQVDEEKTHRRITLH